MYESWINIDFTNYCKETIPHLRTAVGYSKMARKQRSNKQLLNTKQLKKELAVNFRLSSGR